MRNRFQPPQNNTRGSITVQNSVPAGVATAGSAVEIDCDDAASLAIQVTGTYTGALSVQATVDGTTWVTLGGTDLILSGNAGTRAATIASAATGIFILTTIAGFSKVRVTGLAAMTGTAVVTLQTSDDPAAR